MSTGLNGHRKTIGMDSIRKALLLDTIQQLLELGVLSDAGAKLAAGCAESGTGRDGAGLSSRMGLSGRWVLMEVVNECCCLR